jgi:hypothetical protein
LANYSVQREYLFLRRLKSFLCQEDDSDFLCKTTDLQALRILKNMLKVSCKNVKIALEKLCVSGVY